jgi:type VI protein secretion system component VasF
MSASSYTRRDQGAPRASASVEIQLPWWAIALPAIAFAALLLLILNPADAHAASGDPMVTHVLERIQETVFRTTP